MSKEIEVRSNIKKIFILCLLTIVSLITYADNAQAAPSLKGNPTANHRQTDPFGYLDSRGRNHMGVDYGGINPGVAGDDVYSTISGRVVESRYQTNSSQTGGWGNTVLIESDSGYYQVRYSHLDQAGPSTGTRFNPGDTVGIMGGTGKTGGYTPHLDYMVIVKNPDTGELKAIDPNAAVGMDLDDPNIRRNLIADAESKVAGGLRTEGAAQGGTGGQVTIDDSGGSDACPIGCDCSIVQENQAIIDAVNQVNAEISKANITQPTSIEQMTCADQQLELINQAGGLHSQPGGSLTSTTTGYPSSGMFADLAQQPLVQNITNALNSVSAVTNSIDNLISNSFNNVVGSVMGPLASGSGSTNCGMTEQVWLINQCAEMPQVPNVSDILGGEIGKITGAISNAANLPNRMIEQVCKQANGALQGFTGDLTSGLNNSIKDAAKAVSTPITDTTYQIQNKIP